MSTDMEIINITLKNGVATSKDVDQVSQYGFNPEEVAEKINKKTARLKGKEVKVRLYLYPKSKDLMIEVMPPPVTELLLWKANAKEPSGDPAHKKVGDIKISDLAEIAIGMKNELLTRDLVKAIKMLLGTARSIGLTVEGKDPKEVQRELEKGVYASIIDAYKKEWEET